MTLIKATYTSPQGDTKTFESSIAATTGSPVDPLTGAITSIQRDINQYLTQLMATNNETLDPTTVEEDEEEEENEDEEEYINSNTLDEKSAKARAAAAEGDHANKKLKQV
ncbi:uncharacterized protein BYT42DRAFT_152364 [Radiomyces spectabilis]|uniref:uncharacterized protein n=1 Tax=Radiomyces spectabilis TaxID=64574 RepID=UPI002220C5E7|nr:uncharacterized protein BYT42DRAFT_152364 [Radiomyces spectabilis]KAI8366058.1 hypothetical protein BYT42DRAFT_152364 [Radiomyces spectabilis]